MDLNVGDVVTFGKSPDKYIVKSATGEEGGVRAFYIVPHPDTVLSYAFLGETPPTMEEVFGILARRN